MSEESENAQVEISECAERLSAAAESLQAVLGKVEAQYEALNRKVDRIIAAVEAGDLGASAELSTAGRKTVSAGVAMLLAKSGVGEQALQAASLEKALQVLTVEQRIAVKAELARTGLLQ